MFVTASHASSMISSKMAGQLLDRLKFEKVGLQFALAEVIELRP